MTKVLLFESDYDAVLFDDIKVIDGMVEVEGKSMMVDKAIPVNLRKKQKLFGKDKEPLYILKWNSVEPATNIHKPIGFHKGFVDIKKIRSVDAKPVSMKFSEDHIVTPEMLRKLVGLKILGNMIKTKKEGLSFGGSKKVIAFLVAGIGAVIVFLYLQGYIKF